MTRETVESAMLASVGYDPETETLEVVCGLGAFLDKYRPDRHGVSGVYAYRRVTADEYTVLRAADSIGRALISLKDAAGWQCVKIATIVDGVETPVDPAA